MEHLHIKLSITCEFHENSFTESHILLKGTHEFFCNFHTTHGTNQVTKTQLFLRYLHYNITLNTATCFGPARDLHQGAKQINAA